MATAENTGKAGVPTDPYRAYNFKLEIQGVTEGHFTECTGLEVSVETIRYREGGQSQLVRKIPGRVEYADVTLRYGLTDSQELWNWFQSSVKGVVDRRNVSIVLLQSDGVKEAMRWNLISAWPASWRGVPLDAQSHSLAFEELTLACDAIQRG